MILNYNKSEESDRNSHQQFSFAARVSSVVHTFQLRRFQKIFEM
jgi:hypothetical protein